MLVIDIPERELYDPEAEEFFSIKPTRLTLEHSLLSIRKWESAWKKSFLKNLEERKLGPLEMKDYIRCMTVNQGVDLNVYRSLTDKEIKCVMDYMNDPFSATTFSNADPNAGKGKKETITAELIYFWMSSFQIPFECEKWNLNQLMNLIRIASIKNQPSKKMSKRDIMKKNSSLNAARRAKMGTSG